MQAGARLRFRGFILKGEHNNYKEMVINSILIILAPDVIKEIFK